MPRNKVFVVTVILILAIVLFIGTYTRIATANKPSLKTPNPYDLYNDQIAALASQLQQSGLSQEDQISLEAKIESLSIEATQKANGMLAPHPTKDLQKMILTPTSFGGAASRIPDGIENPPDVNRPLPKYDEESRITSGWRKTTPDHYYLVYVGSLVSDPSQGMVLVFQPGMSNINRYFTPRKSGSIKVIAAQYTYLTLQAENGDIFYFDAAREQFIDSLVVPTITEIPITPTATDPYP